MSLYRTMNEAHDMADRNIEALIAASAATYMAGYAFAAAAASLSSWDGYDYTFPELVGEASTAAMQEDFAHAYPIWFSLAMAFEGIAAILDANNGSTWSTDAVSQAIASCLAAANACQVAATLSAVYYAQVASAAMR